MCLLMSHNAITTFRVAVEELGSMASLRKRTVGPCAVWAWRRIVLLSVRSRAPPPGKLHVGSQCGVIRFLRIRQIKYVIYVMSGTSSSVSAGDWLLARASSASSECGRHSSTALPVAELCTSF